MNTKGSWRFANFYFFYFCTIGLIVPYWSLYLQYLNFSPTEIGQLTAILVVTKVLAPNVWGAVIDRTNLVSGRSLGILRYVTLAALLVYCLLYWPGQRYNFWWMACVLLGYSVFWNACIPQVEAATLNHLGAQRHRYGRIRLWGSIGFIVVAILMGLLLDRYGPRIILHAGLAAFALVFVASFFLAQQDRGVKLDQTVVPLTQLLNRKVLVILFICMLMQASHAPFYTFFSIYLEDYAYTKTHIGWLWSIGVVFEVIIFWYGYYIFQQYRLMALFGFTVLATIFRWLLLAAFPEIVALVWISQGMHAITFGLHHAVMMQLIDQFFQGRYQVRGQALYISLSFGVGGAIGSAASGYIWVGLGPSAVFYCSAVIMTFAYFLYLILPSEREQLPIQEM